MESIFSLASFAAGAEVLFSPYGMALLVLGVVLGIAIGATPGLSPSMGVALLVPMSYGMEPAYAFAFFVAVYQAANYGGSLTAITLNAPGTPSAVVTALDGYKMTTQGKGGEALGYAVIASSLGGLFGGIVLMLFAIPLAGFGLQFGPHEYFALALFGLSTVIGFSGGKWKKTFIAVLFGLLLATIGTDTFTGEERFTLGFFELYDGFSFIPVMIGLFALAEIFSRLEEMVLSSENEVPIIEDTGLGFFRSIGRFKKTLFQSSLIGTLIGIVPGAGATIASFISYGQAKRSSTKSDSFGEGSPEGIVASEAANSSSVGGALIPLLSLGIPGSATDAVLLGAMSMHGLVAGPELFQTAPEIVYGIFLAVILANFAIFFFGYFGSRLWLKVADVRESYLFPVIFALCLLGSFTIRNSLFDCWTCLLFGFVGWLFRKYDYQAAPIVLGLVLGDMIETNLRRAFLMGDSTQFFTRPLCLFFLVCAVLLFLSPLRPSRYSK
ncbi:MAG: tripartite tricarboxylate transporter permease [Bdellovibrionales bacterium]|nr:tripartite tricarboxylate transporter permease [Bdellovibrionales bacterium]